MGCNIVRVCASVHVLVCVCMTICMSLGRQLRYDEGNMGSVQCRVFCMCVCV